ncbi:MAG TPA: hypothetical protein PKE57_03380, partial [Cellvibrionaceae bacterium]|nr:hypothetical protein [Cellvibrionaceae bacterium]
MRFALRLKGTYAAAFYLFMRMLQMLSNKNITVLLKTLALVLAGFGSAQLQANTVEIPALANAVVLDGNPNNTTFAGVLAENTQPFTTESSAAAIGASAWKFNIVHLAHTQDNTFLIN